MAFAQLCRSIGLLLAIGSALAAQGTASSGDAVLSQPNVSLVNGRVSTENFPACSDDGSVVLLISSSFRCCAGPPEEVQVIDTKRSSLLQSIVLSPGENDPPFSEKENATIFGRIKAILQKRSCHSMIAAESFTVTQGSSPAKNRLAVKTDTATLKSKEFELSVVPQSGFCCTGDHSDTATCEAFFQVTKVWTDAHHRFLLVESGERSERDGCEQGPEYLVVPVASVRKKN
jgi:hypothetical protein